MIGEVVDALRGVVDTSNTPRPTMNFVTPRTTTTPAYTFPAPPIIPYYTPWAPPNNGYAQHQRVSDAPSNISATSAFPYQIDISHTILELNIVNESIRNTTNLTTLWLLERHKYALESEPVMMTTRPPVTISLSPGQRIMTPQDAIVNSQPLSYADTKLFLSPLDSGKSIKAPNDMQVPEQPLTQVPTHNAVNVSLLAPMKDDTAEGAMHDEERGSNTSFSSTHSSGSSYVANTVPHPLGQRPQGDEDEVHTEIHSDTSSNSTSKISAHSHEHSLHKPSSGNSLKLDRRPARQLFLNSDDESDNDLDRPNPLSSTRVGANLMPGMLQLREEITASAVTTSQHALATQALDTASTTLSSNPKPQVSNTFSTPQAFAVHPQTFTQDSTVLATPVLAQGNTFTVPQGTAVTAQALNTASTALAVVPPPLCNAFTAPQAATVNSQVLTQAPTTLTTQALPQGQVITAPQATNINTQDLAQSSTALTSSVLPQGNALVALQAATVNSQVLTQAPTTLAAQALPQGQQITAPHDVAINTQALAQAPTALATPVLAQGNAFIVPQGTAVTAQVLNTASTAPAVAPLPLGNTFTAPQGAVLNASALNTVSTALTLAPPPEAGQQVAVSVMPTGVQQLIVEIAPTSFDSRQQYTDKKDASDKESLQYTSLESLSADQIYSPSDDLSSVVEDVLLNPKTAADLSDEILRRIDQVRAMSHISGMSESSSRSLRTQIVTAQAAHSMASLATLKIPSDAALNGTENILRQRLDNDRESLLRTEFVQGSAIGISAGDDPNTLVPLGIWIKGLGSKSVQEARRDIRAFDNTQNGAILGFDTNIRDNLLIGLAYTYALSNTSLASSLGDGARDKQKTKLHIAALYGRYKASPTITVSGSLKYGKAFIEAKHLDSNAVKTNGEILRANLDVSYTKQLMSDISLVPRAGIAFDFLKLKGFGANVGLKNNRISGNRGRRTSGMLDLSLKKAIQGRNLRLIPEVHLGMDYILSHKNSSSVVTTNAHPDPVTITGDRVLRSTYNIGTSLNVTKSGAVEFGIGYDYSFRPGFKHHSGYVKGAIGF
jgi:outer membrane autotransporter protein